MTDFTHLDLSDSTGRLFVIGDIHGHFTLLEQKLEEVGFNKKTDTLVSVGDLVDRGPESHLAVEYAQKPWFKFVRGNHEVMCLPETGGSSWHVSNGGAWLNELDEEARAKTVEVLNSAPYIMEVVTPSGRLVGFVHASYPAKDDGTYDWADAERLAHNTIAQETLVWDRYMVQRAKTAAATGDKGAPFRNQFVVQNVDHVYFGHTPMKETLTVGNCTWLDTGAFATGVLTVLEVL